MRCSKNHKRIQIIYSFSLSLSETNYYHFLHFPLSLPTSPHLFSSVCLSLIFKLSLLHSFIIILLSLSFFLYIPIYLFSSSTYRSICLSLIFRLSSTTLRFLYPPFSTRSYIFVWIFHSHFLPVLHSFPNTPYYLPFSLFIFL